jgi:LemA protein
MTLLLPLLAILFVLGGAMLLWAILTWNALADRRDHCQQVWSQLDQQWRRRADLLPALVDALRPPSPADSPRADSPRIDPSLIEALLASRARAVGIKSTPDTFAARLDAERALQDHLAKLLAQLPSHLPSQLPSGLPASITSAQQSLADIDARLALATDAYNDAVAAYEEFRQSFPANLLASAFALPRRDYLLPPPSAAPKA